MALTHLVLLFFWAWSGNPGEAWCHLQGLKLQRAVCKACSSARHGAPEAPRPGDPLPLALVPTLLTPV